MTTLGIIAGGGGLSFATAREARLKGVGRLVAIAFPGQTPPEIEAHVDELHWVHVGQLGKLIRTLRGAGVSEAVMVGRLDPKLVIGSLKLDIRMLALAARIPDRRADTVLKAIAGEMEKDGIRLIDSTTYLSSCLATKGVMTRRKPGRAAREEIEFGAGIARELARLDIGQTVVVKKKAVVAVEAMEGTDETLRRAAALCPEGMVVVKVSRPDQDMRFDVPVVGEATVELLLGGKASALALEAGRTIIMDRDQVLAKADAAGLVVVGI
ncbi:MAG: UDP-2,3-diacylglucosamine diphosphatase LpxI [Chlamydiota bacterium]